MKAKRFIVEICPRLLKRWHNNKIYNLSVSITKTDVNLVTNKLSIFCGSEKHNCFCDSRVKKNPYIIKVAEGKEITNEHDDEKTKK